MTMLFLIIIAIIVFVLAVIVLVYIKRASVYIKTAPKRKQKAIRKQIEFIRDNPLSQHHLCTSCGWIGYLPITNQRSNLDGTAGIIGGTITTVAGVGSSAMGVVLILIGVPLLFVFGIGLIPIIYGAMLLFGGGTAATAGTAVAIAGTGARQRSRHVQDEKKSLCPQCHKPDLIPAHSPIAKSIIDNNSLISSKAKQIQSSVLENLSQKTEE